jgi:hypothetical protein
MSRQEQPGKEPFVLSHPSRLAILAFLASAFGTASIGSAQTPIGPFLGKYSEGFASQPGGDYPCVPGGVFAGAGTLCTPNGAGATVTSSSSFACAMQPLDGAFFACDAATNGGGIELTFAGSTVAEFGGWFAMNHDAGPDLEVTFFDGAAPVSSLVATLPVNCSWNWLGWELSALGVDRISIKSFHPSTGFILIDDMEANLASGCAAAIYCTAKTNSLGCIPAIGSSGTPSPTAGSGYVVSCTSVRNNKSGLLFYRVNGAAVALPFQGGTLCVQPPLQRTPVVNSGGAPSPADDCTGVFSIDMNSFAVGSLGGNPNPSLTVPGTRVNVQWWGRDPSSLSPDGTTLSDAIQFLLCP